MHSATLAISVGLLQQSEFDDQVDRARQDLRNDLSDHQELPSSTRYNSDASSKGALQDILVTVDGPATIVALSQLLKLWLGRDRKRSVTITLEDGAARAKVLTIDATSASDQAMAGAIEAAINVALDQSPKASAKKAKE